MNNLSSDPLISILMPAKNAELYIEECIQSILAQSYDKWELVVVNDHSVDQTNFILKQFEAIDPRIKVLQNKDHGIISALKMAYANAVGQYITRMDADDIMSSNKLEALVTILIQKGKGHLAIGGVHYFSADGIGDGYAKYATWLNLLTYSSSNFKEIYKECVVPSPCWMIHREDLNACEAFNSNIYPEDYDLCFRFYKAGYEIAGVKEILHHWRDYPSRSSRTDDHYADNRFLDLKIKYFIELDYDSSQPLILWGAGKKGKLIAQKLIQNSITFKWITNNKNKIGQDIYGQILSSSETYTLQSEHQVIISIANPREQSLLLKMLRQKGNSPKIHLFC